MAVSISAGPTTSWRSTLIRLGPWRSMLAITGFSVVLSVFLVWLAAVPFGPPKCDTKTALTMAAAVPALVAPLASYFLTRLLFDLENTRAALLDMATRDSLTQIYNRRYLMERLDIARVGRKSEAPSAACHRWTSKRFHTADYATLIRPTRLNHRLTRKAGRGSWSMPCYEPM